MFDLLATWQRYGIDARSPAQLTAAERDAIWTFAQTLLDRKRDEFEAKLFACDRVYMIRPRGGPIAGLGAARTFDGTLGRRPTVVLEAKWGWLAPGLRGAHYPPLLAARALWDTRRRYPAHAVMGMLTAATEQSFVVVHRYCRRAWPHPERETPADVAVLRDAALRALAGPDWDPLHGVVRGRRAYSYKVPQRHPRTDPAVARLADWYHRANPGQADGDCLPILMPLDARQLKDMAGVVARAALKRPHAPGA